jgi:hydrogenase maturation protease
VAEQVAFSPDGGPAAGPRAPRTVVVGLGNPLLGDDSVGWRVADEVERLLRAAEGSASERSAGAGAVDAGGHSIGSVDVERLAVGGLRLMECLTGYDAAILVDAAEFPDRPVGEIRVCAFDELADYAAGHLDSAHDASLRTALELGRRLGAALPESIHAVTIQAHRTDEFSEELTPRVAAAVPTAARAVVDLLTAAPDHEPPAEKGAIG